MTALRINFPEIARELRSGAELRRAARRGPREGGRGAASRRLADAIPEITEDTMPGELANCMAGRIANLFNFHGPNYVCDAACASALAAISAAVGGPAAAGLRRGDHGRRRPQHGRLDLREVLQDRSAERHRHAALRGRRRRLRDGRGRGPLRAEAPGRRRARRRPDPRGAARHRAPRATAGARASPPRTRWARSWPWSGPGRTRACRPPRPRSWRVTARPPAWATWSRWEA